MMIPVGVSTSRNRTAMTTCETTVPMTVATPNQRRFGVARRRGATSPTSNMTPATMSIQFLGFPPFSNGWNPKREKTTVNTRAKLRSELIGTLMCDLASYIGAPVPKMAHGLTGSTLTTPKYEHG